MVMFIRGRQCDADSKIVPSFLVGRRDSECAKVFINDLSKPP